MILYYKPSMGVIVVSFLTTVWELPDSRASRTKHQVTLFLFDVTLFPTPSALALGRNVPSLWVLLWLGVGCFDIFAL